MPGNTIANNNMMAKCRSSSGQRSSVQFSRTSFMVWVEPATPQIDRSTIDARRRSQQESLLQDIQAARSVLATNPTRKLNDDQIPLILGLQVFLSPEYARQALLDKRRHLNLILGQQGRLREEDLCALSMESSRMACERAHISAKNCWAMAHDDEPH